MIVVDTKVLSQPLRRDGEPRVINWLDQHGADIAMPTQVVAELVYGYERLDFGRRQTELRDAVHALLTRYRDRVVTFDRAAAEAHGWLMARMMRAGTPLPFADSQIAAIAISRNARLATRNVKDFERTGVELIDPWAA